MPLYDPAKLLPLFDSFEIQVIPDPFGWTELLPADPTRVWFGVGGNGTTGYQLTTTPDDLLNNGFELEFTGLQEFKFCDSCPFPCLQWFVYGKGASTQITVLIARIRHPRPGLPEEI